MAQLPVIKRISREDVPGAPGWIDRLLYSINLFFDAVYYALSKNITLEENIKSQIHKFSLEAGAMSTDNTYQFANELKRKPTMLFVGDVKQRAGEFVPIAAAVFVDWEFDQNVIYVRSITGLLAGETYDFVLLLF